MNCDTQDKTRRDFFDADVCYLRIAALNISLTAFFSTSDSSVTISPLFSNKSYSKNSRITLLENAEVLSEKTKVADTSNEFFSNVVKELKIENDNLLTI